MISEMQRASDRITERQRIEEAARLRRQTLDEAARRDPRTLEQAVADFRAAWAEERRLSDERNERESFARWGAYKAALVLADDALARSKAAREEPEPEYVTEDSWSAEEYLAASQAFKAAWAARDQRIAAASEEAQCAGLRAQIAHLKAAAAERPRFPELDAAIEAVKARVDAADARVHLLTGSWGSRYV